MQVSDRKDLKKLADSCRTEPHVGTCYIGSDYLDDEVEFLKAVQSYKSSYHRPNPTVREILAIAKSIGYQKSKEGRNHQ